MFQIGAFEEIINDTEPIHQRLSDENGDVKNSYRQLHQYK